MTLTCFDLFPTLKTELGAGKASVFVVIGTRNQKRRPQKKVMAQTGGKNHLKKIITRDAEEILFPSVDLPLESEGNRAGIKIHEKGLTC